jgi:hypothetical protein
MGEPSMIVKVSCYSDVTRSREKCAAMVAVLRFAYCQSDRFPRSLHLEETVIGVARDADRGHGFLVAAAFSIGDSAHNGDNLGGEVSPQ